MKLIFNREKGEWEQLPLYSKDGLYLDEFLKRKLDIVTKLIRKDWDCVIIIDGPERSGKSTLGITIGTYLSNGEIKPENFAAGLNDAIPKIKSLPEKSVLLVDEGSLIFNSKDAMTTHQKQLMKILDVVGQKSLIFIIILPSFFDLNKSIAVRRSKFLLHVYTDKSYERGKFSYYNEKKKKMLYEMGKKNFNSYTRPKPSFRGSFTNFKPEWYDEYLKIKKKSMFETLEFKKEYTPEEIRMRTIRANFKLLFEKLKGKVTQNELANAFGIHRTTAHSWRKQLEKEVESSV